MKKSVLGSRFLLILLFTVHYSAVTPGVAVAEVPKFISFQGELTDSQGTRITSARTVMFKIYNVATGGSFLWSEAQTVTPSNGIVSAFVGNQTTGGMNLAFDTQYWLGVTVSPDAEMSPRIRLTTSPYAFIAKNLDTGARAYGALAVAETVTASKFVGDGTLLTGIIGTAGPKGDTGAMGVQGPKGDTGAMGATGAKGDTGAQGVAGAMSPQGDTGPQGPKGDTGASGTQGLKGDTGATGATGAKGDTGVQGVAGATGLQGDTGPQGLKGDTGATGSQGVKGDTGAAPFMLNGSNAYYTAGNVGVGDTNPGGKLVVKGNVIVRDTMTVGDTFWVVKENGNVGIGTTSPSTALHVSGTVTATVFSGNGAGLTGVLLSSSGQHVKAAGGTTPTLTAGPGAGTGPTISIVGNDIRGIITVATGTTLSVDSTIVTVSFATAYDTAPYVILTPADMSTGYGYYAASTTQTAFVYVPSASVTTTGFRVTTNYGCSLGEGYTYRWWYFVVE